MADVTVDVILKRAGLFKPDRTIGSFLIHAAQLTSDGEEGVCGMHSFSCPSSTSS
jgi:hypothetical protein